MNAILDHAADAASGTLKSRVVGTLRAAILSGRYMPGDRLNEAKLAHEFHISRIPIREALIQLQESGLVMNHEGRGLCVTKLSEEDIQRINSVRLVMETEAIWLARKNMTPEIAAQLEDVMARMEAAHDLLVEVAPLDIEFHRLIWAATGNPYLARALDSLVAQLFAHKTLEHQIFAKTAPQKAREDFRVWRVAHHRELFDVLMGKTEIDPESAVLAHLRAGFDDPERFSSLPIRSPNPAE
ncbi:MAG TPA: GntR family transcriptional regulator [Rhizomicrobium sp.]|nr:GntR family transcriptional regulator [Rhizomicrobium sp.]